MKVSVRWRLFEHKGLDLVILSKPFKTKKSVHEVRFLLFEGLRVIRVIAYSRTRRQPGRCAYSHRVEI
jgi:hypothetical protein